MKILFLTVILSSAFSLIAGISKIDNNNSFEILKGGFPAGWIKSSYYIKKKVFGLIEVDFEGAKDGNNLLEVTTDEKQSVHFYTHKYFNVAPKSIVKVNIFAKGKGSIRIVLYAFNNNRKRLTIFYPKIVKIDTNTWKLLKFVTKIPDKQFKNGIITLIRPTIIVYKNSLVQLDDFNGEIVTPDNSKISQK